jgi:hypothetical protein
MLSTAVLLTATAAPRLAAAALASALCSSRSQLVVPPALPVSIDELVGGLYSECPKGSKLMVVYGN